MKTAQTLVAFVLAAATGVVAQGQCEPMKTSCGATLVNTNGYTEDQLVQALAAANIPPEQAPNPQDVLFRCDGSAGEIKYVEACAMGCTPAVAPAVNDACAAA